MEKQSRPVFAEFEQLVMEVLHTQEVVILPISNLFDPWLAK